MARTLIKTLLAFGLVLLASPLMAKSNVSVFVQPAEVAAGGGGAGDGDITLVSSVGNQGAGSNVTFTLTGITTGYMMVLAGGGGSAAAPTDNRGHTFTAVKVQPSPGTESAWVYYYVTTATYSGNYIVTKAAGGVAITASLAAYQRTSGSFAVDTSTGQAGSASGTYTTGASATTHADASLAVGAVITQSGTNSAISGPPGWGELYTQSDGSTYLAGASHFSTSSVSGVSLNPAWTDSSVTYGSVLAVFK